MKLLAICDFTVNTGFGIVAENILTNLPNDWDIAVLAINYRGYPHPLQKKFRIYPPENIYGFEQLPGLINAEQPDRIFILNDIWMTAQYVQRIQKIAPHIPIVVYTPIDSENIMREFTQPHDNVTLVTYTRWGAEQIKASGYTKPIEIIPHGANLTHFHPIPKNQAREQAFAGTDLATKNPFVVLYLSRNQPRKRVDLWIFTIAEWIKAHKRDDVYLYYHGATRDLGWDIKQLAQYYGVAHRLILTAENLNPATGIPVEKMKYVYNCADLYFHASACGGWELSVHEAMACKIPTLVPNYSALSDWPKGGVEYININRRAPWHNPQMVNTTHFFYDVDHAIEKLELLYNNPEYRADVAERGYNIATKKEFQWNVIAKQFDTLLRNAKAPALANHPVFPMSGVPSVPNAGIKVWEKKKR